MILQNPWALLGLLIIPLLLILRFLRARPRTVLVPSLLIWEKVTTETAPALQQRRFTFLLILVLQILAITLLILAMSNPAFVSSQNSLPHTIIILDNSVGMTTQTPDGHTRWQSAVNYLKSTSSGWPSHLPITLIETAGATESLLSTHTAGELPVYLDSLSPKEIMVNWPDWLIKFSPVLSQIIPDNHFYVYSDRPLPPTVREALKSPPVEILFGSPSHNIGITHLAARRINNVLSVLVNVRNFSADRRTVPLVIYADKVSKAERSVTLAPGSEDTVIFESPGTIAPEVIEARITVPDDLSCDNQAFLTLLPAGKIKVCVVGSPNKDLNRVLEANPSVEVTHYTEPPNHPADYALMIYNHLTPVITPDFRGNIVVLNPLSDFPPFSFTASAYREPGNLTGLTDSPLLSEVLLSGFHIWQSRTIQVAESDRDYFRPIIRRGNETILGEWRNAGRDIFICSFETEWRGAKDSETDWSLTPYFPIFWTNLINYLNADNASSGEEYGYYKTGALLPYLNIIPAKTGLYDAKTDTKTVTLAVNLADPVASDNNGITKIPEGLSNVSNAPSGITKVIIPIGVWFVLIALVLLLLSWWLERPE